MANKRNYFNHTNPKMHEGVVVTPKFKVEDGDKLNSAKVIFTSGDIIEPLFYYPNVGVLRSLCTTYPNLKTSLEEVETQTIMAQIAGGDVHTNTKNIIHPQSDSFSLHRLDTNLSNKDTTLITPKGYIKFFLPPSCEVNPYCNILDPVVFNAVEDSLLIEDRVVYNAICDTQETGNKGILKVTPIILNNIKYTSTGVKIFVTCLVHTRSKLNLYCNLPLGYCFSCSNLKRVHGHLIQTNFRTDSGLISVDNRLLPYLDNTFEVWELFEDFKELISCEYGGGLHHKVVEYLADVYKELVGGDYRADESIF